MRPTSRRLREYDRWKEEVERAGFLGEIGAFGYTDGTGFRAERNSDPSYSFWIGYRDRDVIIYLPYPESIYYIANPGRITDLCLTLLTRQKDRPGALNLDPEVKREYGLTVIPTMEWHAKENEERDRRYSTMGWRSLDPEKADDVFDRFSASFFRDGGGPNWVREPADSLTWDTSAAYAGGEAAEHLRDDLTSKILRAFQRCVRPGEFLYAFEYQGPIMSFDPRADIANATRDCLAVPILPDSDATFFVAEDFRFGLLAPYPIKEVCTFGPEFIESLGDDWPPRIMKLLRKNGHPG